MRTLLIGAVLLAGLAGPACAEVVLRAVSWQLVSGAGSKPRGFKPIERWIQPPSGRLGAKPRALVTVVNRGPKPAEGVVLRYAVSARMTRVGSASEGVWTVPFFLNERRVPRVGPNQVKEVPLNDLVLAVFLKKSFRSGYWPDAFKIQVMVEPRAGEELAQRVMEQTLPVVAR
ncbi:MAG: hypothetical protein HY554_16845 [Elusimicrobia bacterium]|nr:hypothetical protein [Elusimicrobiota bacterium]